MVHFIFAFQQVRWLNKKRRFLREAAFLFVYIVLAALRLCGPPPVFLPSLHRQTVAFFLPRLV